MAPKESVIVESPTAEERAFQQHVAARGEDEHDADEESVAGIEEGEGEEGDHDEGAAIALPDSGEATEGGKLKMIVSLLKKCLGVKDLASMCDILCSSRSYLSYSTDDVPALVLSFRS